MEEKTRILAVLTVIFIVSVVVVAFGKFLEKNSVEIAPEKAGYVVASDLRQAEKISLEKQGTTSINKNTGSEKQEKTEEINESRDSGNAVIQGPSEKIRFEE